MIEALTKIYFSVFGDFQELTATPVVISELMEQFKDFNEALTPSALATRILFDEQGDSKKTIPLVFSNQNKTLVISFTGERINFTRNIRQETDTQTISEIVEAFEKDVNFLIEKILTKYDKKANRVALIQNLVTKELSDETLNHVFSRIFRLDDDIMDNEKREWLFRIVNRIPFELPNIKDNKINSILDVTRGYYPSYDTQFSGHRLIIQIDTNTIPENKEDRFSKSDINELYKNFAMNQSLKINNFVKNISNE